MQFFMGHSSWVCNSPHQTGRHCNTPSPQWQHPQVEGPLVPVWGSLPFWRTSLLGYHTIKIKLGDGFTIFRTCTGVSFWVEPSQQEGKRKLRKGKRKKKRQRRTEKSRRQGNEETKHKLDKWCSGHVWVFPEKEQSQKVPRCRCGEDPHPAVMLSFVPVLIDLLINVSDVSLLQRKLPVDRGSQHFRRCSNECKTAMLGVLAKEDSEWGQRGASYISICDILISFYHSIHLAIHPPTPF